MIGELPTQLFHHLIGEGFGALGVVRTKIDIDETPPVGVCHLRTESVHLVVISLHRHQGGVVDQGAQDLAGFQIRGNEHTALQTSVGGDGCRGVGQIARTGTAHGGEAQLLGSAEGDGDHPVLEGQGGHVDPIILDKERTQA